MPNVSDDNTDFPRLPLDDEAEEVLDGLVDVAADPGSPHPSVWHEQRLASAVAHGERIAWGVARQMRRDLAAIERYRAQLAFVAEQTEAAIAPLQKRVAEAEAVLGAIALQRRRLSGDREKSYRVPGVLDVPTTQKPGRWAIDNDAARDGLMGTDAAKQFVERVETKVEYRLKGAELRKHLDKLVEEAMATLAPGTPKAERDAFELATRERIASSYAGVSYVPPDITVDFKPLGD